MSHGNNVALPFLTNGQSAFKLKELLLLLCLLPLAYRIMLVSKVVQVQNRSLGCHGCVTCFGLTRVGLRLRGLVLQRIVLLMICYLFMSLKPSGKKLCTHFVE